MPHFPHDHASSSTTPASVPKATKRFITRIFLTMPANTQWSSSVPSIAHWPTELSHVLVSLEDSMRWVGVTFPQPFPPNSVEFHVAKAYGSHFQNQTPESGISGSFEKRTKKINGVGQDRAYKLEPYVQEAGAVYGKLRARSDYGRTQEEKRSLLSRTWSIGEAFGLKSNLKIIHLGSFAGHSVKAQRGRPKAKTYDPNIQTFIKTPKKIKKF
ncbi:hypothetical protein KC19_VG076800 [Ceratodon purpureus]|uniref:Uncharacterized protein n=1 Tax=Ceratodon purpureus TaxID=3225 RepID=A0A8T0HN23_CERPU|nr:hypothetical protein KC19_VG076800 [Ceratodon purpureus]KAG0572213.1 hypothetical protein KC19_VG076800 [Ceratodon purpureus]